MKGKKSPVVLSIKYTSERWVLKVWGYRESTLFINSFIELNFIKYDLQHINSYFIHFEFNSSIKSNSGVYKVSSRDRKSSLNLFYSKDEKIKVNIFIISGKVLTLLAFLSSYSKSWILFYRDYSIPKTSW